MYGQSDSLYNGRVDLSLTQCPLYTSHPSGVFPTAKAGGGGEGGGGDGVGGGGGGGEGEGGGGGSFTWWRIVVVVGE